MDYNLYYKNQSKNEGSPVFRGSNFQKGYGFGDIFKKFFSWIVPIVKKNATPILKDVGRELIKTTSNIAYDTIDGKNFKNASSQRINDTMNYLTKQYGQGKKQKYKRKKKKIYSKKHKKIKTISKKKKN